MRLILAVKKRTNREIIEKKDSSENQLDTKTLMELVDLNLKNKKYLQIV